MCGTEHHIPLNTFAGVLITKYFTGMIIYLPFCHCYAVLIKYMRQTQSGRALLLFLKFIKKYVHKHE